MLALAQSFWGVFHTGLLFLPLCILGAFSTDCNTQESTNAAKSSADRELEPLLGEWVGISYDFDGRTGIALKKSAQSADSAELYVRRSEHSLGGFRASVSLSLASHQKKLKDPIDGSSLDAEVKLDTSEKPFLMTVGRPQGTGPQPPPEIGKGLVPPVPDGFPKGSAAFPVANPFAVWRLAYSVEGNRLTLRRLRDADKNRKTMLSAEIGDGKVVFHLIRARKAAGEVPSDDLTTRVQRGDARHKWAKTAIKNTKTAKSREIEKALADEWTGIAYARDGGKFEKFAAGQMSRLKLTAGTYNFDLKLSDVDMMHESKTGTPTHLYRVDATKTPMEFYFNVSDDPDSEMELRAIFQLNGGELLWCWLASDEKPPYRLTTKPRDYRTIVRFHRVMQGENGTVPPH